MLKKIAVLLIVFTVSTQSSFGQEVYGPQNTDFSGYVQKPALMAAFKTGDDFSTVTKIILTTVGRGDLDRVYIVELDNTMMPVDSVTLRYIGNTFQSGNIARNIFVPPQNTILKPDTVYGVVWYGGRHLKRWHSSSLPMSGEFTSVGNYILTNTLPIQVSNNFIVRIYTEGN